MKLMISVGALLVLACFYGIYFIKMTFQKRRNIKTRQTQRGGKPKAVYMTERIMGIATVSVVVIQIISICLDWNQMPDNGRITGFCTAMTGTGIFGIAVLTMRDSWRAGIPEEDKTELISEGIYKYSRNPAFLGFDLMYIGVLLMYFNPLMAAFTVFAVIMLHLQILQEEKFLTVAFGENYEDYKKSVFRYLGRKTSENLHFEIRHLDKSDDRMAISRIYEESWKFAYKGIVPQDYLDSIPEGRWSAILDKDGIYTLVMLEQGAFIGTSSYCKSRFPDFGEFGEIVSIYIVPEYTGKGYGKKLLAAVTDELAGLGYRDIFLWVLEDNVRAKAFYEKEGFVSGNAVLEDNIGGKKLREIQYCRHIKQEVQNGEFDFE